MPMFACTRCSQHFTNVDSMRVHMRDDHKFMVAGLTEPNTSDQSTRADIERAVTSSSVVYNDPLNNRYHCDVCQIGYKSAGRLREHMRTHTGERPYVCDVCEMAFSKHSSLVRHKQNRKEPCRPSDDETVLKPHAIVPDGCYAGRKGYECTVCAKVLYRPSTLRRHMVTHTGERAFACTQCAQMYSSKRSVVRHMRSAHALIATD